MQRPRLSWRRIGITSAILVALTFILGVTEVWQISVREAARGVTSFYWKETAFFVLPSWFVVTMLAPVILYLSERFPLDRGRLRVSALVHIFAAVAFSVAHLSASSWISIQGVPSLGFPELMRSVSGTYLVYDYLNYWLIVGIAHALQYYERFRERELMAAYLQRSLSEARLQALRGQINPHFLYNTLNSISTMALRGDNQGVVQTLAKLSDLLRATLDESSQQEVPLGMELQLTEMYLDIQQIRFGDRLRVEKELDPRATESLVPSMILQPLVENAVLHGVARRPGEGVIRIRTERDNGMVRLEVRDSGPGFCKSLEAKGIGLSNTRSRLEQLYGESQSFECRNLPEGGASVTITIPVRMRNESVDDDADPDRRRRTAGARGDTAAPAAGN